MSTASAPTACPIWITSSITGMAATIFLLLISSPASFILSPTSSAVCADAPSTIIMAAKVIPHNFTCFIFLRYV